MMTATRAPDTFMPVASASTAVRQDRITLANLASNTIGKWTLGVPPSLLFAAGAAVGILFASLIVLFSHSTRTPAPTAMSFTAPPPVVATWQPNVITIQPAAPDAMFDAPMMVDPPALAAPHAAARPVAPGAATKKPVTRHAVRRHMSAGKQAASSDMLTAGL